MTNNIFLSQKCSFCAPITLFEKKAPKKHQEQNFPQKRLFFTFNTHAEYYVFGVDMNRELLLLLTIPYIHNANHRHFLI